MLAGNNSTTTTAATTTTTSSSIIKMAKFFAVFCLIVASLHSSFAWISTTNNIPTTKASSETSSLSMSLNKFVSVASLSAVLVMASPYHTVAHAVDFTGSYSDPKHVNCLREIQVVTGTNTAKVSGTDGTPGCPPDGSGRPWNLVGTIDNDSILVDFTPKGGPKDLKGVYEPAPIPGIRWPDGNLWSRKDTAAQ